MLSRLNARIQYVYFSQHCQPLNLYMFRLISEKHAHEQYPQMVMNMKGMEHYAKILAFGLLYR